MGGFVAVAMIVMGVAIAGIWTRDIAVGDQVDLADGVFAARDPEAGTLFWPHWLAEYATAAALVAGGVGLLIDAGWAVALAAAGNGALLYTSTNSLGWALARPERFPYLIPMIAGIFVGLVSALYLVIR